MKEAKSKADAPEKAHSKREKFKKRNPKSKLVSVEKVPFVAKAAKQKTEHNLSMDSYDEKQQIEREEDGSLVPCFSEKEVKSLEKRLHYRFKDRMLLAKALTHGSYYFPMKPRPKASYYFQEFRNLDNSILIRLAELDHAPSNHHNQTAYVNTRNLALLAVDNDFHYYLRHKVPWLEDQIDTFESNMWLDTMRFKKIHDPPEVLPGIVKSLVGAIYKDSKSEDVAAQVFMKLFKSSLGVDGGRTE